MKKLLALLFFCKLAVAQVTPIIPNNNSLCNVSGVTTFATACTPLQTSTLVGVNLYLPFAAPTVTDSVPIIQGSSVGGIVAGAFPGQYYSDPNFGLGYNLSLSGGGFSSISSSDWIEDIEIEGDYAIPGVPISSGATQASTATSGTTTTVLHDTAQNMVTNSLVGETLCDGGASATACYPGPGTFHSSQITANTATTITVSPAITGMASGDNYQIMRRQGENRWQVSGSNTLFPNGRMPVYQWNVDKGRTIAKDALHLLNNTVAIPCDPSFGLEFLPDNLINGGAGSGTDDLFTLNCLNEMQIYGFASHDTHIYLNTKTGYNSAIYFGGNGYNAGQINGQGAEFQISTYNSVGAAQLAVFDCARGNWCRIGNASLADQMQLLGSGTIELAFSSTESCSLGIQSNSSGQLSCVTSTKRAKNHKRSVFDEEAEKFIDGAKPAVFTYKDQSLYPAGEKVGLYAEDVCNVDKKLCLYDKHHRVNAYDDRGVLALVIRKLQLDEDRIRTLEFQLKSRR